MLALSSIAFDETAETLSLGTGLGAGSWHVLVSRQKMIVGLADVTHDVTNAVAITDAGGTESDSGQWCGLQFGSVNIIRPCVPVVSTNATALYHGLFAVDAVQPATDFEECLLHAATA